jgi:2-polyprenyl-3-methyl-5-hydroxy-6-metoxy-1,4-benzoquinol methylase
MTPDQYVIRGGAEGRERLRLLHEVMGPGTRALLDEVPIASGSRCLDIGCGAGDVTSELVRAASPGGHALGVDLDSVKIDIARHEYQERGISNVTFECRNVIDWTPGEPFDVVYARFLLTHLTDPAALVAAMRQHLRPGGLIIVEDIDFRGHVAEPPCAAFDRYVELYTASVRNRGADANIGPRLPGLLRAAGFADVRMRLVQPAAIDGGAKLLSCVTFESIAEAVLKDGLIKEAELGRTIAELRAFAADPQTVIAGPRVFQAWGTRPA